MIPLIDIQRQHQSLREELEKEIRDVLERGQFILGKASEALEKEVATLCGTQYGIGVNSGTDALFLALTAWGVGEGDEVITSPYTFFATIEAIVQTGARPVLVDIEPRNYQLDPDQVEQAITSQTQAILPVHLFGHPADMKALSSIAQRHRLAVVEDACQAIGAQLDGQPVGSWGDIGCFSFYPTKNLGGVGDGGMITTSNPTLYEKIQRLRTHGTERKYHHSCFGYNSRLDEIQAAILRVKVKHLLKWNQRRRVLASRYRDAFHSLPVRLPSTSTRVLPAYHLYIVQTMHSASLKKWLNAHGIGCEIYYPMPLHHQRAWQDRFPVPDLPQAEAAAGTTLALPIYPELTNEEQEIVIEKVVQFFEEGNAL
ncbi:dTDP-4-amino-4,6-dideoxygalactose transaminase [Kroppenstedtia sanguinis]|uniref:DegT/DnrJ/EryC1/StrS family aminotransferase n=1 Tax=Kroppenstedtia sanguinis TaxID=1380684 RepID=A0ABW4CBY7_9BACL